MRLNLNFIIKYILMKKMNCGHEAGDSRVSFGNILGGFLYIRIFTVKNGTFVIQNRYTSLDMCKLRRVFAASFLA